MVYTKLLTFHLCWQDIQSLHQTGASDFSSDSTVAHLCHLYQNDIEQVAMASSQSRINQSTFIGQENGLVRVNSFDWVSFLKPHFKKVVGIKSHHHFEFSIFGTKARICHNARICR